ncbi:galactan 5-O-arabinofuranosyltransferase [Mycobacteroides chelonae]|uniref:galactan 5-O-arabinofuranosyltransferase n=1 Tax=Mycobacteroides chelonae TaxID=1774 RepID=UPI0008A9F7F6|nr:galactan 5-O-arabinofuranosyltransferase [Mycobacteroides chelonae]AYM40305.1 arabinofuranosyltransferase [[Mycobacterium] chelonae subsp. gwanakae]OHU15889.1 arabinofuranosyltransferase [Mycobacteroides chelonae]
MTAQTAEATRRHVLDTTKDLALAAVTASAVSVVALLAIARVEWPAFGSSNQLHALTTVGQFGAIAGLVLAGALWRSGRQAVAKMLSLLFLSTFTVVTLGMPLGATKLYLFGVSVDQQFRTEYLTRFTDSPALHDMTYPDMPPFYPAGWFWIGGRLAALTGTAGWEMYKPWAITSLAIAVCAAFILWNKMIRFEYALIVTTATAAVTLAYTSAEPYGAIITVLLAPVLVLGYSGLRAPAGSGWAAVAGVGVFLGFAALFYTLLTAYGALAITVAAKAVAISRIRRDGWWPAVKEPLLRWLAIAGIAIAVALVFWGPYLIAVSRASLEKAASAQHYLPNDGAELAFPMLQPTMLGGLCLLGTVWLVVRARTSARAGALAIGVGSVYLWSLLSMLATLAKTTLLSFRLVPTLTVLLAAAGVFAFIEVAAWAAVRAKSATIVAAVIGLAGALAFSQDIPNVLRNDIVIAYADTDGTGQRADRRPPGPESHYGAIDKAITEITGKPRDEVVVLTADYSFLAFYPYYGFQGLTPHYANPLAQFDKRAAAIKSWEDLHTADEMIRALDALPWRAPTVLLMRQTGDNYSLRLAKDVYPNQPNVKRYTVTLNKQLFADPRFTVRTIGPFVLVVRVPSK